MAEIVAHPQLRDLQRMILKTKDAHSFYEQFGFEREEEGSDSMIRRGPTI